MDVTTHIDQERTALRQLAGRLPSISADALGRMGRYLVGQERKHFLTLARSGSSNGVTWPKDAPITLEQRRRLARQGLLADPDQVGIRSGAILRGFRARVNTAELAATVFNVAPHANAFNAKRKIFPESFPDAWLDGCERIAQRTLDQEAKP